MIESRSLVHRYARALFQIAEDRDRVRRFSEDLALIRQLMEQKELSQFFLHPRARRGDKKEKVDKFLAPLIDRTVRNLICLLIDRGRERILPDLQEEFDLIADEAAGVARAELETVCDLSDDELARIRPRLEKITGKSLHIEQRLNPDILGGIRVRVGSTMIDGSVAAKLKSLREKLMEFKI